MSLVLRYKRKYYITLSGTARRLLLKHNRKFYEEYMDLLEDMYEVRAVNGEEAKQLFLNEYKAIASLYRRVAEITKLSLNEVLRAYLG